MKRSFSSDPIEPGGDCRARRAEFSDYLDGTLSGVAMARLATHLDRCAACEKEFAGWRQMQNALSAIGPAMAPDGLQARLRQAIAIEHERGSHLRLFERFELEWQRSLAPLAARAAGGLALAIVVLGGLSWMFAAPLAVEANDDNLAHLTTPHYLYSQVPPQPVLATNDAPLLVDAKVDASGRVYDFNIVAGPKSPDVELRLEQNLLGSVFQPAMLFGTPVNGHVMLTYNGVSVTG